MWQKISNKKIATKSVAKNYFEKKMPQKIKHEKINLQPAHEISTQKTKPTLQNDVEKKIMIFQNNCIMIKYFYIYKTVYRKVGNICGALIINSSGSWV